MWPELRWKGQLSDVPKLEVAQEPVDTIKMDAALRSIQERYLVKSPTEPWYAAQMGDAVLGSMQGFLVTETGAKGDPLPAVASGDDVEIVLETGKFMPGLVEGLVGCVAGDSKEVRVSFPTTVSRNLGEDLAGKAAIFEVNVDSVVTRQLPELDDAFANSVRPGLTYQGLYDEVSDQSNQCCKSRGQSPSLKGQPGNSSFTSCNSISTCRYFSGAGRRRRGR